VQGGKSYTPADYVRSLKAHYVNDTDAQVVGAEDPYAFNWASLGSSISGWFRPAPYSFHMLGPMDAAAKTKRTVAQRRKKADIAEAVRPDDVEAEGEDQQQTDRNMNILYNVIKENEGCLMTDLLLNHASLSQTIENMFAFSFLVRDRRVKMIDSPDGIRVYKAPPVVKKKKADRAENMNGGGAGGNADDEDAERYQFVANFDEYEWEDWKKVTNEEDTLMPHREHAQQQDERPPAAPQQQRQPKNGKRQSQGDGEAPPPGKRRGRPEKPAKDLA